MTDTLERREAMLRDRLYEMVEGFSDFITFGEAVRMQMRSRVRCYVEMLSADSALTTSPRVDEGRARPVAWKWEGKNRQGYWEVRFTHYDPGEINDYCRNVTPLYAALATTPADPRVGKMFEVRPVEGSPWLFEVWDVEHPHNDFSVLRVDTKGAFDDGHETIARVCAEALNRHFATLSQIEGSGM